MPKVLGLSNMKKRTFIYTGKKTEEEQIWEGNKAGSGKTFMNTKPIFFKVNL